MSGFIGSDPEELRSLAKHMDGGADQLDGLRKQLGGRFQSVRWEGADAQRAKGEFRTVHTRILAQAAVMLRDTAELVRKDAQEQTTTSSGSGAGTGHHDFEIAHALPLFIDADELPELPDETGGLYRPPIARAIPLEIPLPTVTDEPGAEHPVFGPVAETLPAWLNVDEAPDFREPLHTLPATLNIDDNPGLREQLEDLGQLPVYEAYSGPDSK